MRRRAAQPGSVAGFSLSELLVVIALMGLFILFGGPAMADAYRAYKVRSVADILSTDVRAMRYSAVAQRATRSMTINDKTNVSAPNQYTFVNARGQSVTRQIESGVNIDTGGAATISFNNNGATGTTANLTVSVSMDINSDRGDRYTITVTPTGTVSTAKTNYVP